MKIGTRERLMQKNCVYEVHSIVTILISEINQLLSIGDIGFDGRHSGFNWKIRVIGPIRNSCRFTFIKYLLWSIMVRLDRDHSLLQDYMYYVQDSIHNAQHNSFGLKKMHWKHMKFIILWADLVLLFLGSFLLFSEWISAGIKLPCWCHRRTTTDVWKSVL